MEPEKSNPVVPKDKIPLIDTSTIEDVFLLGYVNSQKILVYRDDDTGTKMDVTFRTLTPFEIRDIYEEVGKYDTVPSRAVTERIETLIRETLKEKQVGK